VGGGSTGRETVDVGNLQVTAYGADAAQCKGISIGFTGVQVQCFAANGLPTDTYFTVLYHS
jgi:hypothetical protein